MQSSFIFLFLFLFVFVFSLFEVVEPERMPFTEKYVAFRIEMEGNIALHVGVGRNMALRWKEYRPSG